MEKRIPRTPMSLLLAATVLAWSLSPPQVQHSHQVGADLSHRHDCADANHDATNAAPHSLYASDFGPSHSAATVPNGICGEASHLHFQWLGFRLTFPDDDSPTKKGRDHSTSRLLFVQAGRGSILQVHTGNRLDTSAALVCPDATTADIAAVGPAVCCSSPPVTSQPLCDRARHERSGVQLA
jgi:hypothetical protein